LTSPLLGDLQQQALAPDADYLPGPDAPGRARRLAWADLMQRVFAQDVLVCSRCGGDMRVVGVIFDPAVAERILRHLRLWQRGPPQDRHVVVEPADRESRYVD
jgi:hypothetical protein